MLSSSVVCLSFTILNTFETKKGIIKILVYSSVITVKPVLSGHPLLIGHPSKSWKFPMHNRSSQEGFSMTIYKYKGKKY